MNIHLVSSHAILEYDLLKLFTEIGHDVFSNGAYLKPEGHFSLPRPGVPEAKKYPDALIELAARSAKTELPQELIDSFDVLFFMHHPMALVQNWPKIKHKKVIFYSIGQSTQGVEEMLVPLRSEGLKIVRMSPKEMNIPRYVGADAIIRFYKDPEEWRDWNGNDKQVINFTQSLKGRRLFCHYDHIIEMMSGYTSKIYGTGNEDLGSLNGGELPYELMRGKLRDSRVFVYAGTWPSPYTLAFQEAFMSGIPVVAIGKQLANNLSGVQYLDYYEVSDFIQNGENGFCSDDIGTLRSAVYQLLNDDELAHTVSQKGRDMAVRLFDKSVIKKQWTDFLNQI